MTEEKKINPVIDDEHEKRWYVVNTYAGHENRVKENLEKRVESMGIQDSLFRIVVAEEPEIEIKNGKTIEKMKNMFPGYVFVEMKMTDEAWYVVRNTPGVTGFIGSSGGGAKPFPVSPVEMESILRRMGQSDKKVTVDFEVGDMVKILTGPFSGMEGKVSAMNDQTQTASVMTMLFGRETPTDIAYNDLEKVKE
ncbi:MULTISPECIES: transcription termination/antitermination protein NusG [Erysipelotrichaceae]|jgi:transcriptional antiterminator NusG|uniref:transcription termination/antitermination protein NusG n=1 Tax=Erysipelotrichaceae TaxID=128827 RepID=UPI0012B341C5|nr:MULTISPECIES: transcription termination/antitermination protein NusG [Erysipelotrichaceae]MCI2154213.1 transcription termination/antitermination protein NusG [Solobacterium sp.]MDY3233901.1 transcription termination/antitermination protein NusG [Erysipelotrichaceae bacterium]MDY4681897.1 transcription termination/antitermination protein NusG [Lachnospiraceae bacterium]MCI6744859.1 transcription termination/antitermination protein NusG [Anaerolactibacter massiliensis]MDD5881341.1 transcripti